MNRRDFIGAAIGALVAALLLDGLVKAGVLERIEAECERNRFRDRLAEGRAN